MTGQRTRISLVEYSTSDDVALHISKATGMQREQAKLLLIEAGWRVAAVLGYNTNPIVVDSKGVRAVDVSGLIRIGPSLELEIAPKFLGLDKSDPRWREDFFYLAALSRHGRLLNRESLSSSTSSSRDLSTLVARSLTGMFETRKRRPLRSYRRLRERDFYIDGDPDPIELMFPDPDGFEQEFIRYDRKNNWNAIVLAAARELLPEVSDAAAAAKLLRMIEGLTPQVRRPAGRGTQLPSRHRSWQPVLDLSQDVLNGMGITLMSGYAHSPGFVLSTWRVWEDLLTLSAYLGFGRANVRSQSKFGLGTRTLSEAGGREEPVNVVPDCFIGTSKAGISFILDAKYKGRTERTITRIGEADIYEALAFAKATRVSNVVLCYPATPDVGLTDLGESKSIEKVNVDGVTISGLQFDVRGVSRVNGVRHFSKKLVSSVEAELGSSSM